MKYTRSQIEKAKTAKSVCELLSLAEEESIALTRQEAQELFSFLHDKTELNDEELAAVAGGKGDDPDYPAEYQVGQYVYLDKSSIYGQVSETEWVESEGIWYYYVRIIYPSDFSWQTVRKPQGALSPK